MPARSVARPNPSSSRHLAAMPPPIRPAHSSNPPQAPRRHHHPSTAFAIAGHIPTPATSLLRPTGSYREERQFSSRRTHPPTDRSRVRLRPPASGVNHRSGYTCRVGTTRASRGSRPPNSSGGHRRGQLATRRSGEMIPLRGSSDFTRECIHCDRRTVALGPKPTAAFGSGAITSASVPLDDDPPAVTRQPRNAITRKARSDGNPTARPQHGGGLVCLGTSAFG